MSDFADRKKRVTVLYANEVMIVQGLFTSKQHLFSLSTDCGSNLGVVGFSSEIRTFEVFACYLLPLLWNNKMSIIFYQRCKVFTKECNKNPLIVCFFSIAILENTDISQVIEKAWLTQYLYNYLNFVETT